MSDFAAVPAWVWPVIWVGLSLALLGMLATAAWVLFRKAAKVMAGLGELTDRASPREVGETEHVRPAIAMFSAARDIRDREEERRAHRANRKRDRHDRRMARARLITSTNGILERDNLFH